MTRTKKRKRLRRPLLTGQEQTLLAFLLALLVLGGIVRKLRTEYGAPPASPAVPTAASKHGQD